MYYNLPVTQWLNFVLKDPIINWFGPLAWARRRPKELRHCGGLVTTYCYWPQLDHFNNPSNHSLSTLATSCDDLYKAGKTITGVFAIDPDGLGAFQVRCDMTSSPGKGWTMYIPETCKWISRLLQKLDWLQIWFWKFGWRILARIRQDSPFVTEWAECVAIWSWEFWRRETICYIWSIWSCKWN